MRKIPYLVLGDLVAMLATTLIGFATHGEAGVSFIPRMAAAFIPLSVSWFILAPFLGLFQRETTLTLRQLWRPVLAMIFAAPLAAVLRGLLLSAPVIPIFAVVLAAATALGMLIWRAIYLFLNRR